MAKRTGRDPLWNAELQCRLERLGASFSIHHVYLWFPHDDCCDMDGAIALCRRVDPAVRVIQTFNGDGRRADTIYARQDDGGWTAIMPTAAGQPLRTGRVAGEPVQ